MMHNLHLLMHNPSLKLNLKLKTKPLKPLIIMKLTKKWENALMRSKTTVLLLKN